MKKVTSFDVAREAGVSRTTVSYVLNNVEKGNISEKTKKKVLSVVKELGYVPNAAGKALASKRTRNIGMVCLESHLSHSFLLEILDGLTKVVREHDLRLLIDTIPEGEKGTSILTLSRTKSIDGLILFESKEQDDELKALIEEKFPLVLLGTHPDGGVCSVDVDVTGSAAAAVGHLIDEGHRKIACITNAPTIFTAGSGRLAGYRKILKENDLPFEENLVRQGNFSAESGYLAMKELLENEEFTACFVASDTVAFGAMRAINEKGLEIPDDIAIIGYDNVPLSTYSNPPLSSVQFSGSEMGFKAGKMLIDLIDGKIKPGKQGVLETELIIRESTIGYKR